MNLTSEQIHIVDVNLMECGVETGTLYDDLLDHLCCAVEYRMGTGMLFHDALSYSISELAPNGLKAIENETHLLLHSKFIVMKKILFSSAFIFTAMVAMGTMFKMLHFTGANELLVFGMGGIIFIVTPLVILSGWSSWKSKPLIERIQDVLAGSSAILMSSGSILKLLHLVGANEALLVGFSVFSLGFLPILFFGMYRRSMSRA